MVSTTTRRARGFGLPPRRGRDVRGAPPGLLICAYHSYMQAKGLPPGGTEGGLPRCNTPLPKGQTQRKLGRGDFTVQAKMYSGRNPQQPSQKPIRDHATFLPLENQEGRAEPFRNHGPRPWLQDQSRSTPTLLILITPSASATRRVRPLLNREFLNVWANTPADPLNPLDRHCREAVVPTQSRAPKPEAGSVLRTPPATQAPVAPASLESPFPPPPFGKGGKRSH